MESGWRYRDLVTRLAAVRRLSGLIALAALTASICPAQPDIAMPVSSADSAATAPPAAAQGTTATVRSDAVSSDTTDPASALQSLQTMAAYLGSCRSFFVEINSTTTLTMGDKTRESGGLSRVWFRRPDHVVWTTQSDIGASALAMDGKNCTLYLPALSRYTVTPVAGPPDASLAAMSAPYGMLVTGLFASETTASLGALLTGAPRRLPEEQVLDVQCHHLALPLRGGETEIWIARGPIPLPVKVSFGMAIPASPGDTNAVQTRTEVSFRWRVNVDLPDSTFQLQLPATAKKMDKLGSPVVVAQLKPGRTVVEKPRKSSRDSGKTSRGSRSRPADEKLGLALEPPPDIDQPLGLRSALSHSGDDSALPSLSGGSSDAVVAAAIRGSKPDAVPSGASYQPSQDSAAPPPPASASKSPGIRLQLLDGREINLASYRGKKAVVLDFWATWCGPCRQSMPVVSQVAQTYRSRGVEFFAVNMAESTSDIQQFIRSNNVRIPVALDKSGTIASAFGVTGIPHLVVIGKDGTVTGTHTGADSSLQQNLVRDLDVALR